MKKNKIIENTDISIYLFPSLLSVTLTVFFLKSISITQETYGKRCVPFVIIICFLWLFLFFWDQFNICKNNKKDGSIHGSPIVVLFLAMLIGVWFTHAIWGSGYLSLDPLGYIDNGNQHIDTLFHSSIAESYRRSLTPSTLLNNETALKYHTFSHFLIGSIGRIINIPSFLAYCYIFPVVFIPLYLLSQFVAVTSLKTYFSTNNKFSLFDVLIIVIFNVGLLPERILSKIGIWKTSLVVSESFMVANMVLLFFVSINAFLMRNKDIGGKYTSFFLLSFINSIGIILTTWAKVSVGFLYTLLLLFYIFRTKTKKIKYWIVNFFYLLLFYVCFKMFRSSGGSDLSSLLSVFAFSKYTNGLLGLLLHYCYLLILPSLFVLLEFMVNKYTITDFLSGNTVWIETVIIVSIASFFPGLLFDIQGGSAVYFSYVSEYVALVFLCSKNDIKEYINSKITHNSLSLICLAWCVCIAIVNMPKNPLSLISEKHDSNLSQLLISIREYVGNDAQDYTFFLDSDSLPAEVFRRGREACYVCSAMTGVGIINASYYLDGECYSFLNEHLPSGYGMRLTDSCEPINLEIARIKAKENGKKHLIVFKDDSFEVIDL